MSGLAIAHGNSTAAVSDLQAFDNLFDRPFVAEIGSTTVHYGCGILERLGELVKELAGRRVLVVTDPGLVAAGHVDRALLSLEKNGIAAFVFDGIEENPTTAHVQAGRDAALAERVDFLVGLGGGSAMDVAKGINFLVSGGGEMAEYKGFGKARGPMLSSIGVPTTAGTGSDAQSYALIADASTHRKMACGDRRARFRTVLLDPTLVQTCGRRVTAVSGLDALGHAVESYVSKARTPVSRLFAREAFALLSESFASVLKAPNDDEQGLEAWGRMLLGAHLAGAAIEGSMLGAAHACANPLTARFGIAHGTAVALMLPHVVAYNAGFGAFREPATSSSLYDGLLEGSGDGDASTAWNVRERVLALRRAARLPERLGDCGISAASIPELAEDASREWTGTFNPRPLTVRDFERLYEAAL